MKINSIGSGEPVKLESLLDQLEQARRDGAQVSYHLKKGEGTVEVQVSKVWSPLRYLANRFGHKSARAYLAAQVENSLQNPVVKKSLKDRLVRDLGNDTLPHIKVRNVESSLYHKPQNIGIAQTAREQLEVQELRTRHHVAIDFKAEERQRFHTNYARVALYQPEELTEIPRLDELKGVVEDAYLVAGRGGYKTEEERALLAELKEMKKTAPQDLNFILREAVQKPRLPRSEMILNLLSLSRDEAGEIRKKDASHQILLLDAKLSLKTQIEQINRKLPNIGIAETRIFLDAYCYLSFLSGTDEEASQVEATLKKHFRDTRQEGIYTQAVNQASVKALHDVRNGNSAKVMRKILDKANQLPQSPANIIVETAVSTIDANILRQKSVTGDRQEQVHKPDLELLLFVDNGRFSRTVTDQLGQLKASIQDLSAREDVQEVAEFLETLDVEKAMQLTKKYADNSKISAEEVAEAERVLQKIALAHKVLFDIQAGVGRKWGASILESPQLTGKSFSRLYKKLREVRKLGGEDVDLAQLEWMKAKNHGAIRHPKVVIEGAGPNGLMTAIKLYMQGADVTVLERRGTDYSRSQILRLDSQWVNELQFILGDRFQQMFDPVEGKGKLSPDGSASIVTSELEWMLHDRFSELLALEYSDTSQAPEDIHLKRHAAFAIDDVDPPKQKNGHYQVKASYQQKYDKQRLEGQSGGAKPQEPLLRIEADILVCAGGKNSPTRDMFFNHSPVTDEAEYGVASWSGEAVKNPNLDTFDAIQGVIEFDRSFKEIHKKNFSDQLAATNNSLMVEVGKELGLERTGTETSLRKLNRELTQKVVQLRTFENRELIYIGMEIPTEAKQWFSDVDNFAKKKGLSGAEGKELKRIATEAWFQSVADWQGFSKKAGATTETINHQFTGTFTVAQSALAKSNEVVKNHWGGPDLVVVPIGDAATSPHFMSASGLTGGRENMAVVTEFVAATVSTPDQRPQNIARMDRQFDENSKYVLGRGRAYLETLPPAKVKAKLKKRQLDYMVQLSKKADVHKRYHLESVPGLKDEFLVSDKNKRNTYQIRVDDNGGLLIYGVSVLGGGQKIAEVNSFKQFELQYL